MEPSEDAVYSELLELAYPIMRTDAAVQLQNVTLDCLDEDTSLGVYVSETDPARFESVDELYSELREVLPADAVSDADTEDQ